MKNRAREIARADGRREQREAVQRERALEAAPGASEVATSPPRTSASEVAYAMRVIRNLFIDQLRSRARASLEPFDEDNVALDFDLAAAAAYGRVRARLEASGTPIGPNDMLIAAHALSRRLTVVTDNTAEFRRVKSLKITNWRR